MRERTLMMIARVVSILLTPFYLPLAGLVALFIFSYMSQLPFWYKILVLLLVYLFTALLPRMLIQPLHQLPRLETLCAPPARTTHGALSHLYCQLFSLLLCHEYAANAVVHVAHCRNSTLHTNLMRHHQRVVETLHPHGCHWRICRSTPRLCCTLRVQSSLVALAVAHHQRYSRHQPNDSPAALSFADYRRILHRAHLRLCRNNMTPSSFTPPLS